MSKSDPRALTLWQWFIGCFYVCPEYVPMAIPMAEPPCEICGLRRWHHPVKSRTEWLRISLSTVPSKPVGASASAVSPEPPLRAMLDAFVARWRETAKQQGVAAWGQSHPSARAEFLTTGSAIACVLNDLENTLPAVSPDPQKDEQP